jgi:hypothetical protein
MCRPDTIRDTIRVFDTVFVLSVIHILIALAVVVCDYDSSEK